MLIHPRKKRTYPVGTFINTVPRVLAIMQLCLAFTLICWNLTLPFMGNLYEYKSRASLYQTIIGKTDFLNVEEIASSSEPYKKQLRNQDRFERLPDGERQQILAQYRELQTREEKPFTLKLWEGVKQLLFKQPTFQMAWLCLALIIPLMVLLKIESSAQALWLLPLVAAVYAMDSYVYSPLPPPNFDAHLYPAEQVIIDQYLETPLSKNIFEQREQLLKGWQLYLVEHWLSEVPSTTPSVFMEQVERAEYAFHLTRLKQLPPWDRSNSPIHYREPTLLLLIYVCWNAIFALGIRYYHEVDRRSPNFEPRSP